LFCNKRASLAFKAGFKAARLLPEQLFAGWQFAKTFNRSSERLVSSHPRRLETLPRIGGPASPSPLPPYGKTRAFRAPVQAPGARL